jgi:Arc/MetJ-type ribon-helix-helix transcriptional regulator
LLIFIDYRISISTVGQTKRKAVFTAEPEQLRQIEEIVRSGEYRSASEFLREAIDEKLHRIQRKRLEAQVAAYCAEGYGDEDRDLSEFQAFDSGDDQSA